MKLSFSLASKPSSNLKKPSQTFAGNDPKASASAAKEYVTEFDASKAPAASDSVANYIIPPKANEWEPRKRMKNIDLPPIRSSDDQPLQFEVDTGSSVEPSSDSVSYGLNIRQSADDPNTDKSENPKPSPNVDPMLHRLKEDLMRLPDDNGMDEFTDMPVEGFGAALLKGYGWSEGRGIGRNAKEDVKVREYKRWSAKEGIGFTAELPNDTKVHKVDGGEKRDKKMNANGKEERGEKEGKGLFVGKNIRIVGGREIGMKGKVVEVKSGGNMVIRLSSDDREVIVQSSDVAKLGSVEEEKCMRKLKELKIKDSNKDSSSVRHRRESRDEVTRDREIREERSRDRRKDSKRSRDESNAKGVEQISWLTSHIRVRVISKTLKGGKLYLKKGEVVDVVGPSTCDISMDESRELIQGVNQNQLETALPRRGGPVLVLCGRHKGVYGSLVERDTEKETGVVRHGDTHELLNVRLEQIAEYTGDPSYIGY
ncbi:protein MOS2-like [Ipomoea triloba]|uniref:protein MOS2-like n=1 Tax=Ipomoea triloba TaxID=35885 RepID=UPI00125DCB5F|nr:protein MOS2-like [Ipomoea triloba]XP_031118872.1 protein MOS2-like [Ipomoea triloba]XP_031118873.1 protein MOS2-like [Ipomoea triloba]XP_031118875.1 protein MOS2-like [Ipomoea triloba]XP_031118876.1 protein MOS2-like [Ipomoea triloba]XP_031118877.1 protein MOS2-like [Ipomoea triloba]XP_031118878.1 protein MOS2-like [Ipomoea triloba]